MQDEKRAVIKVKASVAPIISNSSAIAMLAANGIIAFEVLDILPGSLPDADGRVAVEIVYKD